MSDTDPTATISQLSSSLGALEAALDSLLATPFDDLVDQASDSPLVQARMQILASYVVHDLIWVYLKTAGVEPANHPVMQEIDRLKGYFGKLKQAETGAAPASESSKPRMQIDRAAANRFISAAIQSGKASVDPDYTDVEAGPSGTHTRFDADSEDEAVDAEVDRLLEDKEDEGEDAEVEEVEKAEHVEVNGKGKGKAGNEGTPAKGAKGKKRQAMDPFAGYDQPKPSTPSSTSAAKKSSAKSAKSTPSAAASSAVSTPQTGSAKRKRASLGAGAEETAGTPSGGADGSSKKGRKKLKMKGEKADK
ncbi:hypothetical protein JCM8097_006619 [Rhodosporidiobolus ruineniae]